MGKNYKLRKHNIFVDFFKIHAIEILQEITKYKFWENLFLNLSFFIKSEHTGKFRVNNSNNKSEVNSRSLSQHKVSI